MANRPRSISLPESTGHNLPAGSHNPPTGPQASGPSAAATVIIRPARLADLPRLTELLQLLFAIEADFSGDPGRQRRGLELLLASENACLLAAEAAGEVVGMASGQSTISTAEGGPALLVEDVVVLPQWQGRGIGRKLLAALVAWAEKRGISRLQLLADRDNAPALAFYEKLGWQTTRLVCLRCYGEPGEGDTMSTKNKNSEPGREGGAP